MGEQTASQTRRRYLTALHRLGGPLLTCSALLYFCGVLSKLSPQQQSHSNGEGIFSLIASLQEAPGTSSRY